MKLIKDLSFPKVNCLKITLYVTHLYTSTKKFLIVLEMFSQFPFRKQRSSSILLASYQISIAKNHASLPATRVSMEEEEARKFIARRQMFSSFSVSQFLPPPWPTLYPRSTFIPVHRTPFQFLHSTTHPQPLSSFVRARI